MTSFIELTESQHSKKILINLKEITFLHASEKKQGKTTTIHFTSSTYGADRSVEVTETYEAIKGIMSEAGVLA